MKLRFTIRDLILAITIVAMAIGWLLDHRQQRSEIVKLQRFELIDWHMQYRDTQIIVDHQTAKGYFTDQSIQIGSPPIPYPISPK